MMTYETLEVAREDAILTIRLNRPHRMNAVTEQMYLEIQDALAASEDDPVIRCIVLTGSVLRRSDGERQAFCAGADLKDHAAGGRSKDQQRAYVRLAHESTRRIFEFPKPTIAAINGPARGAGSELALSCDLLVIAEEASIAFPEIGLGTFVGGGATNLLPNLVGLARARELILTGRVLSGREAFDIGLASRCCPIEELATTTHQLALRLAAAAPRSVRLAKLFLHRSPRQELADALAEETEAILGCMETADWREGARAFVEKRAPRFTGE